MLLYPLEHALGVLAFSHEWMVDTPDKLTTFPVLLTVPPVPPFPQSLQRRPTLGYGIAYAGSVADSESLVDELRHAHPPALDLVAPMPYTSLQTMIDASAPHGLHHYNRSEYVEAVDPAVAENLVSHFERVPSPLAQVITARLGGAVARVDPWARHSHTATPATSSEPRTSTSRPKTRSRTSSGADRCTTRFSRSPPATSM